VRDSEAIDSLSPLAEVLFYRLLVTVDDFGRYDGRAAMIKAHCFPIKDMPVTKCAALLQELHDSGLVVIYTVDDKPYVQMCKWDNAPRAKESKFPPINDDAKHLHTDARNPRAVLPLTVTETETETGNRNGNPAPRTRSAATPQVAKPNDVDEQVWNDWIALRNRKRAVVSNTVLDGARGEAEKAGISLEAFLRVWCLRGSQGLQADWIKPAEKARFAQPAFDADKRNREAMAMLGFGNVIEGDSNA
jgi:hypothetical protein